MSHTPDRITVTGIEALGFHGVNQFERDYGQKFVVDATVHLSVAQAAASDDLADTVNYSELTKLIVAIVQGEPVNLIETLAERIADAVLAETSAHRVSKVKITVHKPNAPIDATFADVSVTVVRRAS